MGGKGVNESQKAKHVYTTEEESSVTLKKCRVMSRSGSETPPVKAVGQQRLNNVVTELPH